MCRSLALLLVLCNAACCAADAGAFVLPAHASWEERMARQLDKKLSLELVDTKLSDACELVSQLTGLTLIVAPTVRKNDPPVTLRVTKMDAGTFIKWLTQLTGTFAEIKDQAIFITAKPPETDDNAERTEILALAARLNVQLDLPPEGTPLTNQDRLKIALQIAQKEQIVPPDFPGPDVGLVEPGKK